MYPVGVIFRDWLKSFKGPNTFKPYAKSIYMWVGIRSLQKSLMLWIHFMPDRTIWKLRNLVFHFHRILWKYSIGFSGRLVKQRADPLDIIASTNIANKLRLFSLDDFIVVRLYGDPCNFIITKKFYEIKVLFLFHDF